MTLGLVSAFSSIGPTRFGFVVVSTSIALALYFIFEYGPCHRTRATESTFLSACLAIMILAALFSDWPDDVRAHCALRITHILIVISALLLYSGGVKVRMLPSFIEDSDTRPSTAPFRSGAEVSHCARRTLTELENISSRLLSRSIEYVLLEKLYMLQPIVFCLLVFQEGVLNSSDLAAASETHLMLSRGVLLVAWSVAAIYSRIRIVRTERQLEEVMLCLVEAGDRNLIAEVFRSCNLPTLVHCANLSFSNRMVHECLDQDLLTIDSKVLLVNAFHKCGPSAFAHAIRSLILSCEAEELIMFKSLLDSTADDYDLYRLVYTDMRNAVISSEILVHLREEALKIRQDQGGAIGIKILSDIDDTLLSSGGSFPVGCDTRLPKSMVYPGCLCLMRQLDKSWHPSRPSSNLVFLSARPHVYKDLTEKKSFSIFKDLVRRKRMHTMPCLLSGSLDIGVVATVKEMLGVDTAWKRVGEKKVECFEQYKALYLEYDYVFFGDNGQGDLLAAQRMAGMTTAASPAACGCGLGAGASAGAGSLLRRGLTCAWPMRTCGDEASSSGSDDAWSDEEMDREDSAVSPRLLASLIHIVAPMESSLVEGKGVDLDALRGFQIFGHTSYVGAALELHRHRPELLSLDQVRVVAEEARKDFEQDSMLWAEWDEERWSEAEELLRRDFLQVSQALRRQGLPALEPWLAPGQAADESPVPAPERPAVNRQLRKLCTRLAKINADSNTQVWV
eukprot:TRINITY_DN24588_c0_g2_i4.p1 TRINITY_DN24588_c0_g2~~TRINITY_DN24588_c0_g2_i4.p1  ORF type:complete len:734 (+),score=132.72 TRINITY_DN24588_c0_g2_i4:63-2264(+)